MTTGFHRAPAHKPLVLDVVCALEYPEQESKCYQLHKLGRTLCSDSKGNRCRFCPIFHIFAFCVDFPTDTHTNVELNESVG